MLKYLRRKVRRYKYSKTMILFIKFHVLEVNLPVKVVTLPH